MNNSQKNIWHWLTPILISLAVTVGTVAMFAGGMNARMIELESESSKAEERLERINIKLDTLATKDDLKEFKQDVKEDVKDRMANRR